MIRSQALSGALLLVAAGVASAEVTYLPAAQVATAFGKGSPLLEVGHYKIHASRREAAGEAEIHTRDTDVIYVLDGEATFVTGGAAVGAKEIAEEEIRGERIDGGETRTLRKGDVIVVPNGTPHWFEGVKPPFLYYVVKVRAPE